MTLFRGINCRLSSAERMCLFPAEGPRPSRGSRATSSLRCPLRLRAAAALRAGVRDFLSGRGGGRIALPAEAATAAAAAPAVRWWGFSARRRGGGASPRLPVGGRARIRASESVSAWSVCRPHGVCLRPRVLPPPRRRCSRCNVNEVVLQPRDKHGDVSAWVDPRTSWICSSGAGKDRGTLPGASVRSRRGGAQEAGWLPL